MHSFARTLLFAFFVAVFLLGAPAVVLYTAGYRYNPVNGLLVRTGVLAVTSTPRGARISLNGKSTDDVTPIVFNRIMPGEYIVTLDRDSYHSIYREVEVSSGRTTYINDAYLFYADTPELVQNETANAVAASPSGEAVAIARRSGHSVEVWMYNFNATERYELIAQRSIPAETPITLEWNGDREHLLLNGETISQLDTAPTVELVDNSQAIEVRASDRLIALLPSGTYELAEVTGTIAVIRDARDMLYVIDVTSDDPILLTTRGTTYDYNENLRRFVWSDGIELNAFELDSRTTTFVTRQSEPILYASWHPTGQAIIAATATSLRAFTFEDGIPQATITLAEMDITTFWHESSGRYVHIYGTKDGVEGIYRLRVK